MIARMLAASRILILFVAAEAERSAAALVWKLVLLVVARTFRPLALPVREDAPARAWRRVQLPQQDRVAVRHETVLLLKLVAVVVVAAGVAVVAVAVVVGSVEARHGRATVERSLTAGSFYQLSRFRRPS